LILHIIRKEILQGILSLRLPLTLILVTAVMVSGAFLFIEDHGQQLTDHSRNVNDNLEKLSRRADGGPFALYSVLSFSDQWIYRRPAPLAFLAEGHEKDLPNAIKVDAFTLGGGPPNTLRGPTKKLRGNALLRRFEDIDWAFVISVIMSFLAIVLVYDSISGEREGGTLKLSMSNSVPRSTIILGKYLGIMVVLIIPLLTGILLSVITVTTSGKVSIVGADWLRIGVIVLLSVLYLSIFVMLGLFVSTWFRSSAASLVLLLLLWAVIVVVIPDIGSTAATSLSELPGSEAATRNVSAAWDKAYQEYNASHPNAGRWMSGNWSPGENLGRAMAVSDEMMRVYRNYLDKMVAQVRFGYSTTRISPTTVYRRAVESVAGSGIDHYESFMNQAWEYRAMLQGFLLDHYPLDIHRQHEDRQKLREALSTRTFAAADVPKFHDDPIPIEDCMKNSMWDIAILIMFNVAFFMAAYVSFIKQNVK